MFACSYEMSDGSWCDCPPGEVDQFVRDLFETKYSDILEVGASEGLYMIGPFPVKKYDTVVNDVERALEKAGAVWSQP